MTLYETDFYAWVHEQATLLAEGRVAELDVDHLIEELEDMAGSATRELYHRLIVLLAHLLKLQVAAQALPGLYARTQRGWQLTCDEQRYRLARLLGTNPSLRQHVEVELAEAYKVARVQCLAALGVDQRQVPAGCPWGQQDVLADDWYPVDARR